ncbi:MAG: DMT family transporter [Ruminococcaceae bacterium]|nr:DMT family transporter [Oscillospiraceae bacterium]
MKTKPTSILLLFLTAIIWGFAFVAQVEGAEHIGPFTLNGVRFAIGTLSLLPVVLFFERGRVERRERLNTVIYSAIAGAVLCCASMLQQFGIHLTGSAGVAGFITGLYTVFIPLACFVLFRSKTGFNVWLGAIFAIVGLFLLCYTPGEGLSFGKGELLLLIGSFFWTAHMIIVDRLGKGVRSLHFAWGQFAVCSVLGLIGMLLFEAPTFGGIYAARWSLLYCGVLSVGVAYTLQVVAQRRADPTFAAIVLSTESVFSAVGGVIFGIDTISIIGYIGCLLIFGGIVVSQLAPKKSGESAAADNKSDGECQ